MPTFAVALKNNAVIVIATIAQPAPRNHDPIPLSALVDTGATKTVIAPSCVPRLPISPVDTGAFLFANGETVESDIYRVRVDIPVQQPMTLPDGTEQIQTQSAGMDLEVGVLPYEPQKYQLILGMDFLSRFHISMFNGIFVMSI
jgi:hypothetical protein